MAGLTVLDVSESPVVESSGGLEVLLRYIYTSQYLTAEDSFWPTHLENAQLAKNFGLHELESHALAAFEECFIDETNQNEIIDLLTYVPECKYTSKRFEDIVQGIREKHFDELAENPGTALLVGDQAIKDACLRRLSEQSEVTMQCEHCKQFRKLHTAPSTGRKRCSHEWAPWSSPVPQRAELHDEDFDIRSWV